MAEAIGVAASIAGLVTITFQITKYAHEIVGSAINAPKEVQELVSELTVLRRNLEPLQSTDSLRFLSISETLDPLETRIAECLNDLERLHAALKKKPKPGTMNQLLWWKHRAKWPLKERETKKCVDTISRLRSNIAFAIQVDEKRKRDFENIMEWIYEKPFGQRHRIVRGLLTQGSGKWLIDSDAFQAWKKGLTPSRVLLGLGIAGAGKTYLSSVVIDYLDSPKSSHEICVVAHVYFEYQEQKQQTPSEILRSLLKQILWQLPQHVIPSEIEELYKENRHTSAPSIQLLTKMLLMIPPRISNVFVVCDGLDEMDQYNQREFLFPLFHRLTDGGFRLFLTSRPHPLDVQESFCKAEPLDLVPNRGDIERYVESRIRSSHMMKQFSDDLRERVLQVVTVSGEGIFLIAKLNMDCLRKIRNEKELEVALTEMEVQNKTVTSTNIEARMDHVYDRILTEIRLQPYRFKQLAFRTLSWLCGAARTLKTHELLEAVSIDPYYPEKWDGVNFEVSDLLDYCNGLVVVDERTREVRILHYSAPNYLERHKILETEAVADVYRAHVCLSYFSIDAIQDMIMEYTIEASTDAERYAKAHLQVSWSMVYESKHNEGDDQSLAFASYAATNLERHLSAPEKSETLAMVLRFLQCERSINLYVGASSMLSSPTNWTDWDEASHAPPSSLQLAAFWGHGLAVASILETNPSADVNANPGPLRSMWRPQEFFNPATALIWAVAKKHQGIVEMLLQHRDIDINLEVEIFNAGEIVEMSALKAAVLGSFETLVGLLVGRDDVDLGLWIDHSDTGKPRMCSFLSSHRIQLCRSCPQADTERNSSGTRSRICIV